MQQGIKQEKRYLTAEAIMRYFKGDEKLSTEIMCNTIPNLVTSDQSLYEALGSFEDKSQIDLNKLVKFLEVVEIMSYAKTFGPRKILTPQRVDELWGIINKNNEITNTTPNTVSNITSDTIQNTTSNATSNTKLDTNEDTNKSVKNKIKEQ
ncbi:hypothetical protein J4434_08530 [Candidatus Woesearchaeota archaeon]|nr:hypothetical protein [Candidatus Woesearchaeota archaeon]